MARPSSCTHGWKMPSCWIPCGLRWMNSFRRTARTPFRSTNHKFYSQPHPRPLSIEWRGELNEVQRGEVSVRATLCGRPYSTPEVIKPEPHRFAEVRWSVTFFAG